MPRYRLTGLLAKVETVEGTDSVPVAGTDGIQLEEHLWSSIEVGYLEENNRDNVAGQRMGLYGNAQPSGGFLKVTAAVALKGAGAAYAAALRPEQDVLLRIAGLAATVDATASAEEVEYSPAADDTFESATVYAHSAGLVFKGVGCRARITGISFVAARVAVVTYEIWGRLASGPAEAALPAITYPRRAVKPPVLQAATLTLSGYGASFRSATLEPGTEVSPKPRGNATGGHGGYEITNIAPHLVTSIDRPSLAALNPWALREAATEFGWELTLGGTQYNRVVLAGPAGQIVSVPHEEAEGLAMVNLRIRLNHTDAASAFTLTFT